MRDGGFSPGRMLGPVVVRATDAVDVVPEVAGDEVVTVAVGEVDVDETGVGETRVARVLDGACAGGAPLLVHPASTAVVTAAPNVLVRTDTPGSLTW